MKLNPLIVFVNYHFDLLKGNIMISRRTPENNSYPDHFQPFLYVQAKQIKPDSPVRLLVKFKVRKLNLWQRILLPILSIPFFAGVPGFIDKAFLLNQSENSFCGFYTWRSREDAERYIHSYPGKLMSRNALPNTLTMEIFPIT